MSNSQILIVEDEQITAIEIETILDDSGYDVLEPVETGEECLESLKNENVDLVLMDIRIPGERDGIETTREINNNFEDIPVCYLSAYSDDKTLEEAQKTKPSGFLIKPISDQDLLTSVETGLKTAHKI